MRQQVYFAHLNIKFKLDIHPHKCYSPTVLTPDVAQDGASASPPPAGAPTKAAPRVSTIPTMLSPKFDPVEFLIQDLITRGSTGLFVGDSGLGKTPFLVQLALCVANGRPFLGHPTHQTSVLYVDAESLEAQFYTYVRSLCKFLDIPHPEHNFVVHSPIWHQDLEGGGYLGTQLRVERLVEKHKPGFVILDCLRPLFPDAEKDPAHAAGMWQWQRKLAKTHGLTMLTVHHRRKLAKEKGRVVKVSLSENPFEWFEEASGHKALINQADFRIGFDCPTVASDPDLLLIAGFSKSTGTIDPIHFDRVVDEASEQPLGYHQAAARLYGALREDRKDIWRQLPDRFRFKEVKNLLGVKSNGPVGKCINALQEAGLCKKLLEHGVPVGYKKLVPNYAQK